MVLAQKQTWRPWNTRPRYEFTQLCPPVVDKSAQTYDGEKTTSSINVAGKTGYLHAENRN
jgi:hypothetical protein